MKNIHGKFGLVIFFHVPYLLLLYLVLQDLQYFDENITRNS